MNNWIWPLKNLTPMFPDDPGRFGVQRLHDYHTGVDLYCEMGQEVVAVEDGEVTLVEWFTGAKSPEASPWWNDTQAILIKGESGVVTYGEVKALVNVGDKVSQGQVIAIVEKPVLTSNKGRPMVMLHIELMSHDATVTLWWRKGEDMPSQLRNPEPFLLKAAREWLTQSIISKWVHNPPSNLWENVPDQYMIEYFVLTTYDGTKYIDPETTKKESKWWSYWTEEEPWKL